MKLPDAVDENLSFLLAELDGQLARLISYFEAPQTIIAEQLFARAGYSNNLSGRVSKACLAGHLRVKKNQARQLQLQSIDTIARNLDLISRIARRAVAHAEMVQRIKILRAKTYLAPLAKVRDAVGQVQAALKSGESKAAVDIGRTQEGLAVFHDQLFRTYTRDMGQSKQTEDLAQALLTINEINRLGEALEAISEALLSINIGQDVRFERYFTLRSVLADISHDDQDISLQPLAETRSGSAIS
ncbi:MAG: hypothetical protein ACPGVJ_13065, partial [Mangrovicoccus sp.]